MGQAKLILVPLPLQDEENSRETNRQKIGEAVNIFSITFCYPHCR